MKGCSVSLVISISATALGAVVGTLMGIWAGYLGGRWDHWIMRVADVLFSFPSLLLAIFVMAILGEKTFNIVFAIGIVYIPQFARISRGAILTIKTSDFVKAARSSGAGSSLHPLPPPPAQHPRCPSSSRSPSPSRWRFSWNPR